VVDLVVIVMLKPESCGQKLRDLGCLYGRISLPTDQKSHFDSLPLPVHISAWSPTNKTRFFLSPFKFSDRAGMLENYIKQTTFPRQIYKIAIRFHVFSLV
jgi:hypothetical protein